jgi:hypothetical protein
MLVSNNTDVRAVGMDSTGATVYAVADPADGSTFTATSTVGSPIQAVYESSPSTVAAGKLGQLGMTAARELLVSLRLGKTLKTYTGTISADTDVVAAVTAKRIKVVAYAIHTTVTTEQVITFKSNGTSGTALWTVRVQAITGSMSGANLTTSAPSFLFATTAGEKLTADLSAATSVDISLTYYDDDAS